MNSEHNVDITVLMTVYNGGDFLKKSIESVLCQTFDQFEFVIVDDCSSDSSVELIKSYSDPRIVICENRVNLGQTKSLNIGLNKARGKYIARMDADDLAFPEWLDKVYRFAEDNPEYCVVSPRAIVIDEHYKIKQVTRSSLSFSEIIMVLLTESPINHVGALIRRKEVADIGGYDEQFTIVADYALWSSLVSNGHKLMNIPEVLTAIRIHSSSVSQLGHGQKNMTEATKIMIRNISQFTDCKIKYEEVEFIWRFIHNMRKFPNTDFKNIDGLLDNIYAGLKASTGIVAEERDKFRKQKRQEICLRKIFICISMKKPEQSREILGGYVKKNGYFSLFGFLYFVLVLGLFPRNFEKQYFSIRSFITRIKFTHELRYISNPILNKQCKQLCNSGRG